MGELEHSQACAYILYQARMLVKNGRAPHPCLCLAGADLVGRYATHQTHLVAPGNVRLTP